MYLKLEWKASQGGRGGKKFGRFVVKLKKIVDFIF